MKKSRTGPGIYLGPVLDESSRRKETYRIMPPRKLLTTSDIGALLNVSRRRAQALTHRPDFPEPFAITAHGLRVWDRGDIEKFQRNWDRKVGPPFRKH